jgi:hypothetical protein
MVIWACTKQMKVPGFEFGVFTQARFIPHHVSGKELGAFWIE